MTPTYTVDLLHALDDVLREVIADAMGNWSDEQQLGVVAQCGGPRALGACWTFDDADEDWQAEWTPGPGAVRIHLADADVAAAKRQAEPLITRLRAEADRILSLIAPVHWDDYEMADLSQETVLELRLAPVGVELYTDYDDGYSWNAVPAAGVTFLAEARLISLDDLRNAIHDATREAIHGNGHHGQPD